MHTVRTALQQAADLAETRWAPKGFAIVDILEAVAPTGSSPDRVDLWDTVVAHLGEDLTVPWERQPGRTRADVAAMLRAAAQQ